MTTKYTYRDIGTGKVRWTAGRFIGWSGKTGPLNVRYAGFKRRSSVLWVPVYLLTAETKAAISEGDK